MADQPVITQRFPYVKNEEAGAKWWCACGRSKNQPYCDGSHKGTGITPVKLELDEPRRVAWCGCKHSANQPLCDGSHAKLDD